MKQTAAEFGRETGIWLSVAFRYGLIEALTLTIHDTVKHKLSVAFRYGLIEADDSVVAGNCRVGVIRSIPLRPH